MDKNLQIILDFLQQSEKLSEEEQTILTTAAKEADKALTISEFQLDRLEKVKRTTAILLEETIEELAQKRKAVEAQNKELEIESSLERMRTVAMGIRKSDELINVAESLYKELIVLGFSNIRNAQIVINLQDNDMYLVCVYTDGKVEVFRESRYETSPIIQELYDQLETSTNALYKRQISGKDFEDWINWRKTTTSSFDQRLMDAQSVSFYLYAVEYGHLGISAYNIITDQQLEVLKRFRNVFELAYRRFMDVTRSEEQAAKLLHEKEILEKILSELKDAQKSLIQAEKMASLGELTAGIAHEIQNPLNFVNNFSEISNELIDEMGEEIEKGDLEEAKFIMADIKSNLEKINHHGKRADAIVKGMLQHSRTSSAEKEPTDINKLADEYFRLAYHGLQAKDKTFNATLETDYDGSIGMIEVIPQDIGRVVLNLFTNAFYAVAEKNSKSESKSYKPTVSLSTKKLKDRIVITVKDNGNGIPNHVLEKIFQPFFTTKPTGKGTGLGLSMSYDIIKAHGGTIIVESEEGKGTVMKIVIPLGI